jgi:hypothetical protein
MIRTPHLAVRFHFPLRRSKSIPGTMILALFAQLIAVGTALGQATTSREAR